MMVLFVVGTAMAAVAGAGLAAARSRLPRGRNPDDVPSSGQDGIVLLLAGLAVTGMTLVLGGAVIGTASHVSRLPLVAVGMLLGMVLFLMHVILRSLDLTFRWGTGRSLELNAPAFVLRNTAFTLLGYVAAGVAILALVAVVPAWLPPTLLIPIVVALFPLYELSVKPRLVFPRSFEIGTGDGPLADLVAWIHDTAGRRRLGRVRVAVIPGDTLNAYATGMGWSGRWILLGEGLVKRMTRAEIKWVAAHELAHVIRRDVPRIFLAAVVTGTLHSLILVSAVFPLYDADRFFAGSLLAAMSGAVVVGILPGLFVRRIELATDKLGVELAGDPDAACSALQRLAEVTKRSPTQGNLTHPPVSKRVAAIREHAS